MNAPNGAIVLPNAQQQMAMNMQIAAMRFQSILAVATPLLQIDYAAARQKARDEASVTGETPDDNVQVSLGAFNVAMAAVDQTLVACGLAQAQQ